MAHPSLARAASFADEVAVGVVVEVAGDFAVVVQRVDAVFLEAVLFVVVVFAEHRALLTHDFAPVFKAVAGKALAVEVDGFEHAAGVVEVVQVVAVGQFAVAELAEGVVAVAQGGPALLFNIRTGVWSLKYFCIGC